MIRRRHAGWTRGGWIALAAGLVLGLGGCGASEPSELRVGERIVTAAEVDRYYEDHSARLPIGRDAPSRTVFVEKLARRLQLVMAAERQGLLLDPLLASRERGEAKYAVLRLFGPTVVDTTVQIGVVDARESFRLRNEERRARQIVVDDLEEAKRIKQELEAGAEFGKLALERSNATRVKYTLGDLGWSRRGRMVAPVDAAIFSLPVGGAYEIAQTEHGHHVIEVTEARFDEPTNADSVYKAKLVEMREEIVRQREADYLAGIMGEAKIVWNEGICDRLVETTMSGNRDAESMLRHLLPDSAETLLLIDGKALSLGACLTEYATYNPGRRAVMKTPETVKHFFRGMAIEHKLYDDALSQGYADRPEAESIAKMGVEIWLAERAEKLLLAKTEGYTPSEAAIRECYDENREDFRMPRRIVIGEISARHRLRIAEADSLLDRGAPFKAVASRYSEGYTSRSGGRLGPFERPYRPDRWDQADTLVIGERTPPFEDEEGWAIVELRKRVPPKELSFEEARGTIAHRLTKEIREERKIEVQALLDEWFPVEWLSP